MSMETNTVMLNQGSRGIAVLVTTQALRSAGLRILVDDTEDANADVNARFLILGRTGCTKLSPRQRGAKRSDMPVEHLARIRRRCCG